MAANSAANQPFFLPGGDDRPVQQEMAASVRGLASQALEQDDLMRMQEQSPAYRALHDNHLITMNYRVRRVEDLNLGRANSTMGAMRTKQVLTCNGCCCLVKFFTVSEGCLRRGRHSDGRYMLFGEGVHVYHSPFITLVGGAAPLSDPTILHGPSAIVTVQQGFVGLAMDRGQPLLLPPGLHQWNSGTIEFKGLIDLSESIIRLGPYTLVTVDEGYAAVTQDNGQQKILEGGQAYMLTHRNWKFEKFITKKLQTNDVGPIKMTTGDNVPLEAVATVNWRIDDVQLAARMSANTMHGSSAQQDTDATQFDISKLRQDVLRQVTASLAAFVGSVSYSAHGHAVMAAQISGTTRRDGQSEPEPEEKEGAKALFDRARLIGSVEHANEICSQYGVMILSINLISAYPADRQLLEALSQGAVATVAAEQTETAARGEAQALLTRAKAEAEAERIRAEGHAAAEEIKAEGSLKAARALEASEVAVTLAKLRTAGECLGEARANSFFFGLGGPAEIPTGVLGTALMAEASTTREHQTGPSR